MTVLFHGDVLDHTMGEKSIAMEGAQGVPRSMRALIDMLGARFGEDFREFLLDDETCLFLVNGSGIMTTGGLSTPLASGDTIEVLPFVDGG